ncbi:Platelet glycoprotein 4 [Eumeta japonica]|uniref:Platelet glycoprotein 4 n=1 Tax=Eumeta variegata TaxID=151549 RepID=A0A4C1UFW0_EUMVA|nr:Platelet glycoprotein 4 [Eumeta japonica]
MQPEIRWSSPFISSGVVKRSRQCVAGFRISDSGGNGLMKASVGHRNCHSLDERKQRKSLFHVCILGSIDASDGSIFPTSMLDRKQTLYAFFPNLCRRLPFEYEKDVETEDGIQLLRYRMPKGVFDDPSRRRSNQCFCEIDSGTCPPRGVINITACSMGGSMLVSFPHFHLGDEKLTEDIIGLRPDQYTADNFIDIHPTLGIVLNGKTSLQINIQVKKTPQFTAFKFLKQDLILPVAWLEMQIGELSTVEENKASCLHCSGQHTARYVLLDTGPGRSWIGRNVSRHLRLKNLFPTLRLQKNIHLSKSYRLSPVGIPTHGDGYQAVTVKGESTTFLSLYIVSPSLQITTEAVASWLILRFRKCRKTKYSLILSLSDIRVSFVQSVGKLPESVRSLVYHGTYSTAAVQLGLTWGCAVGLLVSGCCLAVMFCQKRRKPCATLKKISIELEQK